MRRFGVHGAELSAHGSQTTSGPDVRGRSSSRPFAWTSFTSASATKCRKEYEEASASGANAAHAECLRYVWALVHSPADRDVKLGLTLAERMVDSGNVEEQWIRDLLYLCAVAKYKLRQFLAAREQLVEILKVSPESRQAQSLKTAVDDKIVQEGLVGVGIGAAAMGGLALIVGGILASRR